MSCVEVATKNQKQLSPEASGVPGMRKPNVVIMEGIWLALLIKNIFRVTSGSTIWRYIKEKMA